MEATQGSTRQWTWPECVFTGLAWKQMWLTTSSGCLTCIECSNLPVETLQPHTVLPRPWVKIGVDFLQDHLGKKAPHSSRLLQQVPIHVSSGICPSFQDHYSPEGTLCSWRHTHHCHVWQWTPIQWQGIQTVHPWICCAHHIITPFPSIQQIHRGYGEEGQECLQENWWISQYSGSSTTSDMWYTHHSRSSFPSRNSTWTSCTRNSSFKTIKMCQYTSDLEKLIQLQEKQKENFNKAHRAKDLHVLKVKEKVQFFPNKQGTGPLHWITGTVTEILECGHLYMVQAPNSRVYRRNRAHLKPICHNGSSFQDHLVKKRRNSPKTIPFKTISPARWNMCLSRRTWAIWTPDPCCLMNLTYLKHPLHHHPCGTTHPDHCHTHPLHHFHPENHQ